MAALADEPSALVGANVLTANLPHLPEAALGDVVPLLPRLALEGDDGVNIAATLAARWTFICQASGRDPLQAITGVLRGLARVPRPHMLPMLAALAPALAELGGHAAVEAAAQAVRQAGEWWS